MGGLLALLLLVRLLSRPGVCGLRWGRWGGQGASGQVQGWVEGRLPLVHPLSRPRSLHGKCGEGKRVGGQVHG